MTVNFLRASQTYNAEQKRNKSGGIGKRVTSYDNTFYTDLDVSTPFFVAEILICKFIDDVLLYNHLDEEEKWQYCNLQIVADEVTGKMSFSVRLIIPTQESVYAASYWIVSPNYIDKEPISDLKVVNEYNYDYIRVNKLDLPEQE